jgi:hypothetical protein
MKPVWVAFLVGLFMGGFFGYVIGAIFALSRWHAALMHSIVYFRDKMGVDSCR